MFYLLLSSRSQCIELTHLFLQVYERLFTGPAFLLVISMLAYEVLCRDAFEESLDYRLANRARGAARHVVSAHLVGRDRLDVGSAAVRKGLEHVYATEDAQDLRRILGRQYQVVVANPPYVRPEEYDALPVEVRADPRLAVVGGLEVYRRLFDQAAAWLRPGGGVVVEIAESRGREVTDEAESRGFVDVRVVPDLNGRDRVVEARWWP